TRRAHRRELAELVQLAQRQERRQHEGDRQDRDDDLRGERDVVLGQERQRRVVLEEGVRLLDEVDDDPDGDETRETQDQVASELTKEVAIQDPHATASRRACSGASAGGRGGTRRCQGSTTSQARAVWSSPMTPSTRFATHIASHG